MIIDIHSHLISPSFNFCSIKLNLYTKLFQAKSRVCNYPEYIDKMRNDLNNSKIDKVVLLAIENGVFSANNEQTARFCNDNPQFLYGANLNPYSDTIEQDFYEALKEKAVLIKILPSFQNVDLSEKKCTHFFELLFQNNIPLLVHTGMEHTYKNNKQCLNNPAKLELAAKMGVKVICAHCGTNMFLHEKSFFNEWKHLILKYDNVYGDLSGMISPVRTFYLKEILKNRHLLKKVILGTDYPAFPFHFFKKNDRNIYNDWYNNFVELGFSNEVFTKANEVLNL